MEILAATDLLRRHLPDLAVRMVNVVDLMRLQPPSEHPHGLPDAEFDAIFTTDRPVIFAYHGYPWLIHRLTPADHLVVVEQEDADHPDFLPRPGGYPQGRTARTGGSLQRARQRA